ncbi:unnamed protein product [Toxocara canis]|uniref:Transmembrane protein n=1 Tax=Toxocara canis TaxID=6265 RepID=A0A183V2I4_TOXCA|nr:unnamed protein product [Toxocara canis]
MCRCSRQSVSLSIDACRCQLLVGMSMLVGLSLCVRGRSCVGEIIGGRCVSASIGVRQCVSLCVSSYRQMILFYATFVFLIVLLDGLIPRLSEYFGVMERSDSFAADEVRPVPHNLPPMQIEQATPFSPVPPTSVAPPTLTAEQ